MKKKSSKISQKTFDGFVLFAIVLILLVSSVIISTGVLQNEDAFIQLIGTDNELENKQMHYTFSLLADDVCDDCDDDVDPSKNQKPVSVIYEIVPNPGNEYESISFLGYGDDPDGEVIGYEWNSSIDGIINDNASFSISSLSAGIHTINFYVKDNDDAWSDPANITLEIIENQPPLVPVIGGQETGKPGSVLEYQFITSDPEDQDVYYLIDWDDGSVEEWEGPYESNEEASLTHTWEDKGSYTIKAKAKDAYDEESDWATMEIAMPRSNYIELIFFDFVNKLFEKYPFLQEILLNKFY
ncbi:MAG TPA: PKD domain-containing protein [Candidatus Thermoplasmatota archaeon]|nr:PKD domain-containing protein [Candidatus Thermoplasmatota archaeon]